MSLALKALHLAYPQQRVLRDAQIEFEQGKVTALMGVNGAGKSTLLKALAGVSVPQLEVDENQIFFSGEPISSLSRRERAQRFGYLGQREQVAWNVTTERLVSYGTLMCQDWPDALCNEKVEIAMRATDCWHLRRRTCSQISAGELQRVLVARVIVGAPQVILADEPTSGLDPKHQLDTMVLLQQRAQEGATVIVAMHDISLAAHYCDQCVLLHDRRIYAQGKARDVLRSAQVRDVFEVDWPVTEKAPVTPVRR
ncbi:MAG: ABC-type iron chelate uptake system ATPase component [Idiomarinaceae bacterium HL-53]|nr:MAG: ABC-type iron chelate uptake system ATPase component [Idiomarinaceae bacterium HL-53]CUS49483.1 iron complex transport system ATP-binding protein [Idiomarinaceae bacterium HL-53]